MPNPNPNPNPNPIPDPNPNPNPNLNSSRSPYPHQAIKEEIAARPAFAQIQSELYKNSTAP